MSARWQALQGRGRKGQSIGIDFAIGLSIFLVTIALGFVYANMVAVPSSPFSETVQRSALDASDTFSEINGWTVYMLPVHIQSSYSEDLYPVEVLYRYPDDLDPNSTAVMTGGNDIRSQADPGLNETVFYTNLSGGQTSSDIVYTEDTDLEPLNYTGSIERAGDEIWNDDINLTTDDRGLADLTFQGQQLLTGATLTETTATVNYTEGPLRITATYNATGHRYLRMFDADDRIRLRQADGPAPTTYTLDIIDTIDEVYLANYSGNSQTNTTDQSGTIYSGEADIADLRETGGTTYSLAVMHEDMDVTVENNSGDLTLDIQLTGQDHETLLLPHTGDETSVSSQINLFFDPPTIEVFPRVTRQGLSLDQVRAFADGSTEVIRDTLGLGGLGYNLTLQGETTMGQELPGSQEVAVIDLPTSVLGRFGNTTLTDLRVSIWL